METFYNFLEKFSLNRLYSYTILKSTFLNSFDHWYLFQSSYSFISLTAQQHTHTHRQFKFVNCMRHIYNLLIYFFAWLVRTTPGSCGFAFRNLCSEDGGNKVLLNTSVTVMLLFIPTVFNFFNMSVT